MHFLTKTFCFLFSDPQVTTAAPKLLPVIIPQVQTTPQPVPLQVSTPPVHSPPVEATQPVPVFTPQVQVTPQPVPHHVSIPPVHIPTVEATQQPVPVITPQVHATPQTGLHHVSTLPVYSPPVEATQQPVPVVTPQVQPTPQTGIRHVSTLPVHSPPVDATQQPPPVITPQVQATPQPLPRHVSIPPVHPPVEATPQRPPLQQVTNTISPRRNDHTYSSGITGKSKRNRKGQGKRICQKPKTIFREDDDNEPEEAEEDESDIRRDPNYNPEHDKDQLEDDEADDKAEDGEKSQKATAEGHINDRKFIVFESQLKDLVRHLRCPLCTSVFVLNDERQLPGNTSGSAFSLHLTCLAHGHDFCWSSQPTLGRMPIGNLLISASILFSGQTWTHVSSFAGFLGLEFISNTTFAEHQSGYLFPVVHKSWEFEKQALLSSLEGKELRLGGDGRCDSPGYSAKYCTYSMMDLDSEKIVDFEVVQVTQATSSVAMEKKGFQMVTDRLKNNDLKIKTICTDRHPGIASIMAKEYKDIEHQFDVWHLSKSVLKRLTAKAKKKECEALLPWIPSIKNHLWWSASTCNRDVALLLEKWRSVGHHVTNRHQWNGSQQYHECSHGPLSPEQQRKKKWMVEGSPAHEALVSTVNDKFLLKGVEKINGFQHTGPLEVYNGAYTKYCPKRQHFPMESMVARAELAALDHNHNTGRQQAVVRKATRTSQEKGTLRYRTVCPKAKGAWVAKAIYEGKNYAFVYDMMASVLMKKMHNDTTNSYQLPPDVAPNIARVEKVPKAVLVEAHTSRF